MTVYNYEQGLLNFLEGGHFLELVLENICKYYLREGDLAIDGGANRGRHTIPMAGCVGNSGLVVAIEAIPELAAALRSKVDGLPVSVISKALSAKAGRVEFAYCIDRDTRSGIHARKFIETMDTRIIEVEAVTLDGLIEEVSQVSIIKLDLEGGEYDALRGAEEILKRDQPLLIAEHGGLEGAQLYGYCNRDYYQYLCDLGYTVLDLLVQHY